MTHRHDAPPTLSGAATRGQGLVLGVALAVLAAAVSAFPLTRSDTWLDLAIGRLIVQSGSVPRVDVFSHTVAGAPWVAGEWLGCVLLQCIAAAAGVAGLITARVLLVLGVAAGWLMLCRRRPGALWGVAVLGPLALSLWPFLIVRPALVSSLLLVWQLVVIDEALRSGRRWMIFLLIPLYVLWVNLTSMAVFGVACLLVFATGATIQSVLKHSENWLERADMASLGRGSIVALWIASAGAVLALFANPYGVWAPLQPLQSLAGWIPRMSVEHQSTLKFLLGSSDNDPLSRFVILGLAVMAAWACAVSRMSLGANALMLFATVAGLWRIGSVLDFSLLAAALVGPALGEALAGALRRIGPAAMSRGRWALLAVSLAVMAGVAALAGPSWRRQTLDPAATWFPERAFAFFEAHRPSGEGFHPLEWGGAVLWRLGGAPDGVRVYADGRLDVYGLDFLRNDYSRVARASLDDPDWHSILEGHDVRWVLLNPRSEDTRPLAEALYRRQDSQDPAERDWALVHFDSQSLLFYNRAGVDEAQWSELALGFRADLEWLSRQEGGLLRTNPQWRQRLLRLIEAEPDNVMAVRLLLAMEEKIGSDEHRGFALERLLEFPQTDGERAATEHALGLLLLRQGDAAGALGHLQAAVTLAPESIPHREGVAAALWNLRREEETVAAYRAILELDPSNAQARQALSEHEAGTLFDLGPSTGASPEISR